jgi:hypothetical protein
LFGCHVADAANESTRFGQRLGRMPCEAKIEELGSPVGRHKYVARLDVAMDQAVFVCFGQCLGDLSEERGRPVDGKGTVLTDHRMEVGTGDEVHHVVFSCRTTRIPRLIAAGIETSDDIWVMEPGNCSGFQEEPVHELGNSLTAVGHHFEGHRSAQMAMLRAINHSHSTPSERLQQPVMADQQSRSVAFTHHVRLESRQEMLVDERGQCLFQTRDASQFSLRLIR